MHTAAKTIEYAFLVAATWGWWRSFRNLRAARTDLRNVKLRVPRDPKLRIIACGYVRAEWTRLAGQSLALVGAIVMLSWSGSVYKRLLLLLLLLGFVLLLNLQSEVSARARAKVIRYEERHGREDGT